jgi:uncharacterized protein (TIGR03067 family)
MSKQLATFLAFVPTALAAAILWAGEEKAEKPKKDGELIQGRWKVIASAEAGKDRKPEEDIHLVFGGEMFTIQKGKEDALAMRYTLDPTTTPKQIDTTHEIDPGKPIVQLGIYALEGDSLKLSLEAAGKPRPTAFESKAKSTSVVFVLKRAKDAGK